MMIENVKPKNKKETSPWRYLWIFVVFCIFLWRLSNIQERLAPQRSMSDMAADMQKGAAEWQSEFDSRTPPYSLQEIAHKSPETIADAFGRPDSVIRHPQPDAAGRKVDQIAFYHGDSIEVTYRDHMAKAVCFHHMQHYSPVHAEQLLSLTRRDPDLAYDNYAAINTFPGIKLVEMISDTTAPRPSLGEIRVQID